MNPKNLPPLPFPYRARPATESDRAAVQKLVRSVLIEYGLPPDRGGVDADLAGVPQSYTDCGGFFGLIELESGELVGTFGLFPLNTSTAEVRKMYLRASERGRGLGRYMLGYLTELARQQGYQKLQLETASVLTEAIALYQKQGFKKLDRQPQVGRCDAVYELEL